MGITIAISNAIGLRRGARSRFPANRRNLQIAHIDDSLFSSVSTWAATFACFLVCREVEGDEEEEVGGEDD